jgi:hypothetical protein
MDCTTSSPEGKIGRLEALMPDLDKERARIDIAIGIRHWLIAK